MPARPDTPPSPDDLVRRLTDLEVKASFQEDALDQLSDIVARQQREIDALRRELTELRQRQAPDGGEWRSLRDELPPHY